MSRNLQHRFSLQGKQVLITGATGYLGCAMTLGLAELGAHVLVNGRSHERVMEIVAMLHKIGLTASPAVFDIKEEDEVANWFIKHCSSTLHGIVNNAYAGGAGSIESAVENDYRDSYEVSLVSAHRVLQHGLPFLRAAVSTDGAASVVNIGSMYGMVSPDQRVYEYKEVSNPPFYGAAKAALLQWTRYAACEFGSEGIRINAISPGPFPSENVQKDNSEFVAKLSARVPLGRIGQAEEIQGPLAFLISDASSFVNGANIVVDGGWTCW